MTLAENVDALAARVAAEFQTVRSEVASPYVRASDYGWSTSASASANDAAIAAAITAARTTNRRLYLGSGTYNISAPIDIRAIVGDGSSIEIFGDTRATTIINQTTATADVMQAGGYNVYVHDMTLRHSEAAFSATPTTLGAGFAMFKLAYGSVSRVQLTANGYGIRIADADVFEPGTSVGTGNYFHSISFTDCYILRYGVSGISLNVEGAVSTGSSFRGIWIQNNSTGGTPIASTGRPLDLYLCDEMTFTQLNIEDGVYNMPVLVNSCGAVMFESLHFERIDLSGSNGQYIRVAGGSQAVIDGVTFAFSDVAPSGTGRRSLFSAVSGGQLDVRGVTYKNMDNTAALVMTVIELDDTDSKAHIFFPGGGDNDEFTAFTNTANSNPGMLRNGDKLTPHAMPDVLSWIRVGTIAAGQNANVNAATGSGNNIDITFTGDGTIAVPTNPSNGQVLQYSCLASGGARTVTIASGIQRLTGVNASYAVPSGKVLRVALRYSALAGAWLAESAAVQQ